MKTIASAESYGRENNMLLKGTLAYDPYLGWHDKAMAHPNGYAILCNLNIAEGICPGCKDEDPCKMGES